MTFCLGIKVKEGLICLADGRVTSGNQVSNAQKVSLHDTPHGKFAIMTSGLRSLRDKTLAYLDRELMRTPGDPDWSMLDAIGCYCRSLRRVAKEDREALAESELQFNLHAIVAGQMLGDREPGIFLVYPEGNWIEVDQRSPFLTIGATSYGKPILDRALTYQTRLRVALKLAYLSFDSTRISAADVGFPIDLLTFGCDERRWRHQHYDYDHLRDQRVWWNEHITKLAAEMPDGPWVDTLLPGHGEVRLSLVTDD